MSVSMPLVGSAARLAAFVPDGFGRRVLLDNGRMRVVLVALEKDREIPPHAPQLDLVVAVLAGTGRLMAGESERWVRAGDVAAIPAGATRGLRAEGGALLALHVVSPPPGEEDHGVGAPRTWSAPEQAPDVGALILAEHRGLRDRVAELASLADRAATMPVDQAREQLDHVVRFLRSEVLAHAAEEERSVYPAVEEVLQAVGGATGTMAIDHRRIAELTAELAQVAESSLGEEWRAPMRRRLQGLAALLEVHLRKEEEVYLPLLARLSPAERGALYARLTGVGTEES